MNNLDPKGEFNFILQELKSTNQNNQLKKMRENQKAIECLVSVQKYVSDNAVYIEEEQFAREINDFIDQKISELKGE